MSCPPELRLSIYADGEVGGDERRALEAHLIGCEACRGRVLALREEAEWLADALQERPPRAARLPSRAAPARGLALGGLPALAAAALVAAVLGWLLEARLVPAAIGWLNPLAPGGLSDMAFDLVFLLRDAPGVLPMALAGAGILGVSALLSFALGAAVRRWAGPGPMGLALLLLLAPSPGHAHFGLHRHDDFTLASGEVHDGTLLVSGDRLDVDGVVEGDLIAMGERLSVRGEVRGNLFALARSAEISGAVGGTVWCVCRDARVGGSVESDLYALAHDLEVPASARIGRSVAAAGEDLRIEGAVGRDLIVAGERAELRGSVERDVYAWHTRLSLRAPARVGRDVTARLHDEGDLSVESGARVAGETRTELVPHPGRGPLDRYRRAPFYWLHAIGLAGAFLVGMALHALAPGWFSARLETSGEFFRTLGLGFLALVASPIAVALLALTLVGIPLALLGLAAYLAALYLSAILVAALVGAALLGPRPGARGFGIVLLVGLLLVTVTTHLPFVGVAAWAVVALTGLGLLVRRGRDAWSARRAAT